VRKAVDAFVLTGALVYGASASALSLNYPNFSSTGGLKLNGDAAKVGNVLRLVPHENEQTGSAFTNRKVLDPGRSFKTKFRFQLWNTTTKSLGDGLAFVLKTGPRTALGDGGGGLGYGGLGSFRAHNLAVEFDLFDNGDGDPNGNHIAVHRNGDAGNALEDATPDFQRYGEPRTAWINYSARAKKLKVYADDDSTRPAQPLITVNAKLGRWLGDSVRAGVHCCHRREQCGHGHP
jgi:Legume lectin domain